MDFLKKIFDFILMPFKLMFGDPDKARILRDGKTTMAKIINIGESDMGYVTVNDQPYAKLTLEIYPEGEDPYTTTLGTILPRLSVSQFQPGTMVNVKVDPLNKLKVVFDTTPTTAANENMPVVGNTEQKPIVNGKQGMAEVLAIKKSDKEKNGNPVYILTLEITGEGIEKYSFDKEIPLPEFALPYITVGKKYGCRVDGEDKTKVEIDVKFNQ
jgi:hypothetical protein